MPTTLRGSRLPRGASRRGRCHVVVAVTGDMILALHGVALPSSAQGTELAPDEISMSDDIEHVPARPQVT